jgi:hypothetical protein
MSKTAALIGEFVGREGVIEGTRELVAALNAKMLSYTYRQIYAPNLNFSFRGRDGELHDGKHLLKHIAT